MCQKLVEFVAKIVPGKEKSAFDGLMLYVEDSVDAQLGQFRLSIQI